MKELLARAHAVLGALLGVYVLWHLWRCLAIVSEPLRFVVESSGRGSSPLGWLVLAALILHAVLGGVRAWLARASDPSPSSRGLRLVQLAAGLLVLVFVVRHVAHVGMLAKGPERGAHAAYAVLHSALAHPAELALYVVGITAVCFHLAHGLARALTSESTSPSARLVVRFGAGVVGFALWGLWLQPLALLGIGQPLW